MNKRNFHRILFLSTLIVTLFVSAAFSWFVVAKADIYLKAGNIIRFTKFYDSGAKQAAVTEIESVTATNGVSAVNAKCKMYDDVGKFVIAYKYKFYVDSLHWCADALNWMYVSDKEGENLTWVYESDSLVYPFNMKAGDTLMPATARKASSANGMSTDETQFTYNRKVIKLDTVQTIAGPMAAFRITSKVSVKNRSSYGPMGTVNDDYVLNVTQWFNADYGIVQEERAGKYNATKLVLQALK